MIDHKHKYIFIHIPKNGGTSIEQCLFKLNGIERPKSLSQLDEKLQDKYHVDSHTRGHFFHKEFDLKFRKEYFSFTFVRNPYDKIVSEFLWLKNQPVNVDPSKSFNRFKDASFLDFLQSTHPMPPKHGDFQYRFLDKFVDFIGRFENLQQDFDIVCDKIGIQRQKLPHKNASKRKHYTEYYDDETKSIVADRYAKDIEYFGYKFGD